MRNTTLQAFLVLTSVFVLSEAFQPRLNAVPWQDDLSKIEALQNQAEAIGKRNVDSVLLLLRQAESLITSEKRQYVFAQNNWVKAKTYYGLRDYDKAISFGEQGMTEASASENYDALAKISNLLGVIAKRRGDLSTAGAYYKTSLESRKSLLDSLGMSKTLQNLGNLYRDRGLSDSAFYYYQRSIDMKVHLDDPISLAKTIVNLGNYFYETGAYLKAIDKYKSALPHYEEGSYEEGIARVYNNIGAAYQFLGFYQLSLSSYIKGLEKYKLLSMRKEEGNTLYNIGALHRRLLDLKTSIDYYAQSLDVYELLEDELGKAKVYLGISIVYILDEEPVKAIESLDKSREIYSALGREKDLASVEHAYGRAYAQLKEYAKAKTYYKGSIEKKKGLNDSDDLGDVYSSLAVANYELGEHIEARSNYLVSLTLAKQYRLPALVRASLLGLSETNEALGNTKRAYNYRLQYETIKDSLDNVEKSRQLAELREIYESERKDEQISQLELQNEVVNARSEANAALASKERTDKFVFILTAIILFVLGLIIYFYYRQRLVLSKLKVKEEKESHNRAVNDLMAQQQTKTLETMVQAQEEERIRIAKELHDHFGSLMAAVKVNLTTVAANSNINTENDRQMKNLSVLVDQACEDIRSLSHSMHIGISETFGLIPALKDLSNSIAQSGEIKVEFLSSQCADNIDVTIEVTAYRLVQELVGNVLKHAKASRLSIQLTCLDDILSLIVEDNGVGFDVAHHMNKSEGIGLGSLKERVNVLDGEFEVDSQIGKGTTVIIDLPMTLEQTKTAIAYD